ncbi:MAG: SagB/ThcOx family dehydrogenase, partial [Cyanobacteria bacterium P01_F01_bin.42]
DPETIGSSGNRLDPSQQPVPYKTYQIGTDVDLNVYLETAPEIGSPEEHLFRLSRLLYLSYGITGVVPFPDSPFYMRSAPSAGGLYPAEVYLIARDGSMLPAGLYNYQAQSHHLIRYWDNYLWSELEAACLWHPSLSQCEIALVVTAVFQRSAWRYQDRAYRRIFLDSGHLLGNIELAANLQDYRAHLIGGFQDQRLNNLLFLDSQKEGAIAVLTLADLLLVEQNLAPAPTALPSNRVEDFPEIPDGDLLHFCHQATEIQNQNNSYAELSQPHMALEAPTDKYNFPFGLKLALEPSTIDWGDNLDELSESMLKRRSTRRFSGRSLNLEQLAAIIGFAYHPETYVDQLLDSTPDYFDLSLIETFIAVTDVEGLEEGCYYYAVNAQELRQIRFKNFRAELHFLCLQQDLGRDAAAIVFHTADLTMAVDRYGDRAYRYLHMDAGHLGQRINLAATQMQVGVSGIGGFFDDLVNEVLGIPTDEAVLYITTLGQPVSS